MLLPCVAAQTKLLGIQSHICLPEWQKWNICCFLLHLNPWEPVGLILLMHQGIHVCHLAVRGFFPSNVWANLLITEGLHTDYCDHNLANIAFITNGDVGDGKPSLILRSLLKSNKIKRNKICVWICYQTFEKHKSGTLPMLLLAIFHFEVGLEVEVHFLSLTLVSCCCVQMEGIQLFDISSIVIIVCPSYTCRVSIF